MQKFVGKVASGGVCVKEKTTVAERRRWPRLHLAIPVFVRSRVEQGRVEQGKEFLEFATALNVSAGGMLVAVRRSLASAMEVSLEIPSAPLAALASLPQAARTLRAKVTRTEHSDTYNLVGLKFVRPIVESGARIRTQLRKEAMLV
jgi:hypothetical protein